MSHSVGRLLILLGLIFALLVMGIERLALTKLSSNVTPEFLVEGHIVPPWGGLLTEDIRRTIVIHWRELEANEASARKLALAESYPLDSDLWMSLARMAAEPGGLPEKHLPSLVALAIGSSPFRGDIHFEAAQIALLQADFKKADSHLRDYLSQHPNSTRNTLTLARRWHEPADNLVSSILPRNERSWEQAMRIARSDRDLALAQALWQSTWFPIELEDRFFLDYVDTLLRTGRNAEASEAWRLHDPYFPEGAVPNWNFGRALGASSGLNWRQRVPDGVRLFRDPSVFQTSPASLRVLFDGTQNVRLDAPSLQVPVQGGARYRIYGYWRAERLSTRSLPYLWLRADQTGHHGRADVPGTDFDWEPWEIHFETLADTGRVRLSLRRDQSRDFESDIRGTIWIDSIRLERLSQEEHAHPND